MQTNAGIHIVEGCISNVKPSLLLEYSSTVNIFESR
jgi:hypothetical protein